MRRALVVCTLVLAAVPVRANDKWEFGIAGGDDDDNTVNALAPGRWQARPGGSRHDARPGLVRIPVRARQSYGCGRRARR